MITVCIESSLSGDFTRNIDYARVALVYCLNCGVSPYASHLLLTQVYNDLTLFQREVVGLFSDCTQMELEIVAEAQNFLLSLMKEVEEHVPGGTPIIIDLAGVSNAGGVLPGWFLPMEQMRQISGLADNKKSD